MPCNLSVSITKASVTNEQLLGLLTPEVTIAVVKAALSDLWIKVEPQVYGGAIHAYAERSYSDQIAIVVRGGNVEVQASSAARATEITDAIAGALAQAADALFAQTIVEALARVAGKYPVVQQVPVQDAGAVYRANIFTVKL